MCLCEKQTESDWAEGHGMALWVVEFHLLLEATYLHEQKSLASRGRCVEEMLTPTGDGTRKLVLQGDMMEKERTACALLSLIIVTFFLMGSNSLVVKTLKLMNFNFI